MNYTMRQLIDDDFQSHKSNKNGFKKIGGRPLSANEISPVPFLQRRSDCACGGGCPVCQAKSSSLQISQPNDASEIEADQIAHKVMRMSDNQFTPSYQNHSHKGNSPDKALRSNLISSPGKTMDDSTQNFMQSRFGTDFGDVRIHTDNQAVQMSRALHAKAFTAGSDIYFNEGRYQTDSDSGKHLLAHELAHVVQQGQMPSGQQIHRFGEEQEEPTNALENTQGIGEVENFENTPGFGEEDTEGFDDIQELQRSGRCSGSNSEDFWTQNYRDYEFTVPSGCRANVRFDAKWNSYTHVNCCTGADTYEVAVNGSRTHTLPAAPNICNAEEEIPYKRGSFNVGSGHQQLRINVNRQGCDGIALNTRILITIR